MDESIGVIVGSRLPTFSAYTVEIVPLSFTDFINEVDGKEVDIAIGPSALTDTLKKILAVRQVKQVIVFEDGYDIVYIIRLRARITGKVTIEVLEQLADVYKCKVEEDEMSVL